MSDSFKWHAAPSGDSCLVLEFASVLSLHANRQAASAAAALNHARDLGRLVGLTDIVPGMVTVGVHYRPEHIPVPAGVATPYAALLRQIEQLLAEQGSAPAVAPRRIEIPMCYGGEYGPDLHATAQACGVSAEQLIALHSRDWLDVLMVGFTPGHPYIGILDPVLNPPRRSVPRTLVPRGSVGLANRQTNVYPVDSPGGWHLIGRTPLAMFNAEHQPPCRLQSGDQVRFVAIDSATFEALQAEAQP
ncbi:MAG: 5-oxoprolinase subunit PxpB [Janthinobacterium lividum]